MEPTILDAAGWAAIGAVIGKLVVFAALVILGAFSMLLSQAVLPSLATTRQIATDFPVHRRVLVGAGLAAFALAIVQLARIVGQLLEILGAFYPRFGF